MAKQFLGTVLDMEVDQSEPETEVYYCLGQEIGSLQPRYIWLYFSPVIPGIDLTGES